MICLNLPESRKFDLNERKEEDLELLYNLMQNRMDLDPDVIKVNKLLRLGRRAVSSEGVITASCTKLLILVFHYTLVFTSSDKSFLNSPLKFLALSVVIVL